MLKKSLWIVGVILCFEYSLASGDTLPAQLKLTDYVTLEEATETNKQLPLEFGVAAQDVDINSIIHIKVDQEGFFRALGTDQGKPPLTTQEKEILRLASNMNAAYKAMEGALDIVTRMQELVNQGKDRNTPEFQRASENLQSAYNLAFNDVLLPYRNELEKSTEVKFQEHGREFRDRLDELALVEGVKPILPLITAEINWVKNQLQQTGVSVKRDSIPIALNLVAYTYENGEQKFHHLPHYDDLPVGTPVNINKLNTVPSPEELAKLKKLYEQAQSMAADLNKIEDKREALKEFLNIALKNAGIDLDPLKAQVHNLKRELEKIKTTDWDEELQRIKSKLDDALEDNLLTEPRKKAIIEIGNTVDKLRAIVSSLPPALTALEKALNSIIPRLDLAAAQSKEDPLQALLTMLETVSTTVNAYQSIKNQFEGILEKGKNFGEGIGHLRAEVKTLFDGIDADEIGDTLSRDINAIFKQFKQEHISGIQVAYQNTESALNDVLAAIDRLNTETQDNLNAYVETTVTPPEMSYFVPLHKVKDSWLDIRTIAARKEGDVVTIQAKLYRIKPQDDEMVVKTEDEIDAEAQQLRLLRFGLYGAYNVGLAYVESLNLLEGQTEKTQSFQPNISWIVRYRGWRNANQPARYVHRWYKSIGIGIHTITLDLDKDNQTEIGAGITISIFDEMFQVGYGRDLNLKENYYFIATRLLEFGKKQ